jgi:hypothetical protein
MKSSSSLMPSPASPSVEFSAADDFVQEKIGGLAKS